MVPVLFPPVLGAQDVPLAWDFPEVWRAGDDGPIDVFDPEGNYVGTFPRGGLRMPRAFGPDGLVAYWETDDMDILSVVVYRLPANLRR